MTILELHHFRLPVCRFVIDLFDKKVMRQVVLEEEDSAQDSSDDSDEESGDNESGEEEDMENGEWTASP
jgi:rapamycin-insensitive companion of mTOR